jgi:FkbM family methyltransferase
MGHDGSEGRVVVPKWKASREFSIEFLPLILLLVWRSIVEVKPLSHRWQYFRALVLSIFSTLIRRHVVMPTDFLQEESIVQFNGLKYILTPQVVFGYYLLPFEPYTYRKLKQCGGRVFVDLGANLGQYSLPLARQFRRVIAVEPHPITARILRQNIRLNGLKNVEVVEKAVSEDPNRVPLFEGEFLTTWSTKVKAKNFILVETTTLEHLLDDIPEVDLLKVDIEGAERDVLFSESRMLSKIRALSMETNLDQSPEPTFELLRQAGFQVEILGGLLRDRENIHAVRVPS